MNTQQRITLFIAFGIIYFIATFGFGAAVLIWLAVKVALFRKWINGSVWINNGSKENDLFAVGQAVPAVLFLIPLISAFGGIFLPSGKLGMILPSLSFNMTILKPK